MYYLAALHPIFFSCILTRSDANDSSDSTRPVWTVFPRKPWGHLLLGCHHHQIPPYNYASNLHEEVGFFFIDWGLIKKENMFFPLVLIEGKVFENSIMLPLIYMRRTHGLCLKRKFAYQQKAKSK